MTAPLYLSFGQSSDGNWDGVQSPNLLGAADSEVIERLRVSDVATFERVYRALRPRLIAIAGDYVPGSVAEEIAQDLLTLLWERRQDWPVARGVTTYLYASARNRARDHARHQGVVGRMVAEGIATDESHGAGEGPLRPDEQVEREESGRAFVRAMSHLPEGARTAFRLRWIDRLSYSEIAEIMQVSEQAARKQVSRARESLLRILKEELGGS